MTLKEAVDRIVALGFVVFVSNETNQIEDEVIYGSMTNVEPFNFSPNHVLSTPTRDLFVGHMYPNQPDKEFWYITSHLKFRARNYRCRNSYEAEILNIFGSGKTFEAALVQFETNFRNKVYNKTA